jgi:hypothetical protein
LAPAAVPAVDVAVLLALRLLAVAAVRPVVLLEVVEGRADQAHKLLPRVRLQVAVVLAPLREALAVVAVVVLVQGPVASESLLRQLPFSASTARNSPSPVQPTYTQAPSTR